jgi:hypothetical protein
MVDDERNIGGISTIDESIGTIEDDFDLRKVIPSTKTNKFIASL